MLKSCLLANRGLFHLLRGNFFLSFFNKMSAIESENSETKKAKVMKTIGTHNGTFHCDEVLACSMLKRLPEYQNAEIIRTRDPSILDKCDIVVDVGGVYDPQKLRFDHHQKSFTQTAKDVVPDLDFQTTRLSSAGLIYVHFGRDVLQHILNLNAAHSVVENRKIDILFRKCYQNFIEEIDAVDNGVSQYDGTPKYLISTTLSSRVSHLNPSWNAPTKNDDKSFLKAVEMVGSEFEERVKYLYFSWLPAMDIVKEAIEKRFEVDPSGEVIVFDNGGCPWKEHLFQLEEDLNLQPPIKYGLLPDEKNGNWMIVAVPIQINSFHSRLALPDKWRGLRDDDLSRLIDLPNCIFCHATGFCGGHKTRDGALTMARLALRNV